MSTLQSRAEPTDVDYDAFNRGIQRMEHDAAKAHTTAEGMLARARMLFPIGDRTVKDLENSHARLTDAIRMIWRLQDRRRIRIVHGSLRKSSTEGGR